MRLGGTGCPRQGDVTLGSELLGRNMTGTPDNAPIAGPLDALRPAEMARACEAAEVTKARRDAIALVVLGVLAGAFIALGAIFMTIVLTGAGDLPWGVARLLAGLVFSLGLILVIVGGAELFTGDSGDRFKAGAMLRSVRWNHWLRFQDTSARSVDVADG